MIRKTLFAAAALAAMAGSAFAASAWTGGDGKMLDRGGRVSRFKDKFKGFV